LGQYLKALDYRFTAEDEALIDRLVASGHPSTPGFNDPAYPIEGRRARTSAEENHGYSGLKAHSLRVRPKRGSGYGRGCEPTICKKLTKRCAKAVQFC
jgi:hypothetical protein